MDAIVRISKAKDMRLVTATFLREWFGKNKTTGKRLPNRQSLPEEAFLDVDALSSQAIKQLKIIAVSYCWVTADHPDSKSYHLATLDKLLECVCKGSKETANRTTKRERERDRQTDRRTYRQTGRQAGRQAV